MTLLKITGWIFLLLAILYAVGCAPNRFTTPQTSVFQPPVEINTPGVYQQMPREMEHVNALELTDTLVAYAPEDVYENATPLNWKGN